MGKKLIVAVCALIFSIVASGYSTGVGTVISMNGMELTQGQDVTLTSGDIPRGSMVFAVKEQGVRDMEISLDGGLLWNQMNKVGDEYVYRYTPYGAETMDILIKYYDTQFTSKIIDTKIRVQYTVD